MEEGIKVAPASPSFLEWMAQINLPDEVVACFAECIVQDRDAALGLFALYTEEAIRTEAGDFPNYLEAGLFSIGHCLDGDPLVVDVRDQIGVVGYISHDDVWGAATLDPREYFVVVAPSLASFAERARKGDLPFDYYDAIEQQNG